MVTSTFEFGPPQTFLTPRLRHSYRFLCEAALPDEGWAAYPGGPIDLHHTALSVVALRAQFMDKSAIHADSAEHQIANAALAIRTRFEPRLDQLKLRELADFATILKAEPQRDEASIGRVTRALSKCLAKMLHKWDRLIVRDLCAALGALHEPGRKQATTLKQGIEILLRLEKLERGGWPNGAQAEPSLVATAMAVETLTSIDPDKYGAQIGRGIKFLEDEVDRLGWEGIAENSGIFGQAAVLKALSGKPFGERVDEGIVALEAAGNDDGWGERAGSPSTVEITATALTALISCGESRFVPYRLAISRVKELKLQLDKSSRQLKDLQENFEAQIVRQNSRILADRNRLRDAQKPIEDENRQLLDQVRRLERDTVELSRQNQTMLRQVTRMADLGVDGHEGLFVWAVRIVPTVLAFLVLAASVLVPSFSLSRPFMWGILGLLLAGMWFAVVFGIRSARNRRRVLQSLVFGDYYPLRSTPATDLSLILSELPLQLREELAYEIVSRISDMPPDVGDRYSREVIRRYDIPPHVSQAFASWVQDFLSLDRYSRIATLEQIRRQMIL